MFKYCSSHQARRSRWRGIGLLWLAIAAAPQVSASQAPGDTIRLTLAQARALAQRANPELLATRVDTTIAHGVLRQAGILRFNPSADLLAASGGNGAETGVSQELELFGQRSARLSVGRASYARASASVANATRLTLGEVERAFYRLAFSARRTALADEVLALNERLQDIAQRQLSAGEISRLDLNLVTVERGRSRARALAARRDEARIAADFGRALGVAPATTIVAVVGDIPNAPAGDTSEASRARAQSRPEHAVLSIDSLTVAALAHRPDLAEREAARRVASASVSLARREALPNLIARAAAEPRADGSGRVVRPGVGITLPFLNRNQGTVQAQRAATRQAELERYALITRIRTEVATAVATYRSATLEVETLEATVLTPARQNRQLVEIAYREGKVGLPVLLLIRNQAIDAELEYWDAWLESREALAALSEATGANLTTQTGGTE
jgi:cobalt-zinc-cadmium efflux system outer membrane protein